MGVSVKEPPHPSPLLQRRRGEKIPDSSARRRRRRPGRSRSPRPVLLLGLHDVCIYQAGFCGEVEGDGMVEGEAEIQAAGIDGERMKVEENAAGGIGSRADDDVAAALIGDSEQIDV